MIRPPDPCMEHALQSLWHTCFGDDMAYVRFIFSHLLRTDRCLVHCNSQRQPDAMLFFEPFTLICPGGNAPGAYIYGVATSPSAREQGISTRLLDACHRQLTQTGFVLSVLVPASESLFDFYAKRGYKTAFSIVKEVIPASAIPAERNSCVLVPARLELLHPLREQIYRSSCAFVRWTPEYLRYIDSECRTFGGEVLHILCGRKNGYAVCYRDGAQIIIKELAFDDELIPDALAALHRRFQAERYVLYLAQDVRRPANKVLPFAMVRWYDKKKQGQLSTACGKAPWITHVLD